jgi:hypothetical protein
MKTTSIRRSLLLVGMLTFHQFILADSQRPYLPEQQLQERSSMEDHSKQKQTENEQLQLKQLYDQQRTLRGITSEENVKATSAGERNAHTTVQNDENKEQQNVVERQERRRRELRERHVQQRGRIERILQERPDAAIDVIVTLDATIMGQESAAAASDFERTHAKIMSVNMSQYQAMQDDPTILLVEIDALVHPQQQQQDDDVDNDDKIFSLQYFGGQEQTPWGVAAVLQHDFTTIPSTPQPMVVTSTAGMRSSCSVKVCVIDSGCLVDHPDLVRWTLIDDVYVSKT